MLLVMNLHDCKDFADWSFRASKGQDGCQLCANFSGKLKSWDFDDHEQSVTNIFEYSNIFDPNILI